MIAQTRQAGWLVSDIRALKPKSKSRATVNGQLEASANVQLSECHGCKPKADAKEGQIHP